MVQVILLDEERHQVHVLEHEVDLVPQPERTTAAVQQFARALEWALVEVLHV